MMTRKDYVSTAEILNHLYLNLRDDDLDFFEETVLSFALMFEQDNERFNRGIFYNACFRE